jgi:hypothetical protein
MTGDIWAANMGAKIKTSNEIATRTDEQLSTQEEILHNVREANLIRDVVCDEIDTELKRSIGAVDDTHQDHTNSED